MKQMDFDVVVDKADHDEGKLHRLLEGPVRTFPGNASLTQFFTVGFAENRITPEDVALLHDEKSLTFAELEDQSDRLSEVIREHLRSTKNENPDGDSVIAVCMPPSTKLILTLFAIHKLGGAYLPIDVSFPEDRITKIVNQCKPLMIISENSGNYVHKFDHVKELTKVMTTQELMDQAAGGGSVTRTKSQETMDETSMSEGSVGKTTTEGSVGKTTATEGTVVKPATTDGSVTEPLEDETEVSSFFPGKVFPGASVLAERTAIILYTSGSSGEPKGVRLSHRTVMNRLSWQWHEFPYIEDEKCAFKTSLTFVDSVPEIFGPLLQGLPLVIFDKHISCQTTTFMENLKHNKITRLTLVPSLLRAIFQTIQLVGKAEGLELISSVKLWVCSGEPLSYDLFCEFFELFPKKYTLANFYGSTEVMGDVTYISYSSRMEAHRKVTDKRIPIGIPVYNTVLYVLDQEMNMVEMSEMGEIYVAGYNLATNYVGGVGQDKFVENGYTKTPAFKALYKTGDFGRISMTEDGARVLFYEGRVDSQVKVRGQRVDLAEIELHLSEIVLISKVVVLCYHPGQEDQALLAYVVATDPAMTFERLQPLIAKRLKDYETPVVRFLDRIPLLVNGKTDRQRLLSMYDWETQKKEDFEEWDNLEIPSDKVNLARTLFRVISEVTGTGQDTLAENMENSFFNVGGTSLNAVTVVVKLRQHNVFISVGDFVAAKSIRLTISALEEMAVEQNEVEQASADEEEEATEGDVPSVSQDTTHHAPHEARHNISILTEDDKEDVLHTIAYSFSKKGDMEAYTKAKYGEFRTMIGSIWAPLVEKGLSFIVRRKEDKKCVGVSLNFDAYDEPEEIELSQGITYALEILESIESKQKIKLPVGKGKLLHSFMMGTPNDVDEAETVTVIEEMEEYNIKLARDKKLLGVLTTNTNPLTRQICLDLFAYELLYEYPVNQFVASDGTKPFFLAPDSFTIACCWKQVNDNVAAPELVEKEETVEKKEEKA